MENSKPLATESFSYSWLVDRKQHSLDVLTEIIKPNLPQKSYEKDQNFNFDVSLTAFHAALVHADEIFADGQLMPVYAFKETPASVPASPLFSYATRSPFDGAKKESCLVEKWRRSSKRILHKCFGLIRPLYRSSRKNNRVDDLERKVCEVRSWTNSLQASPRPSSAASLKKVRSWGASPQASPRLSPSRASSAWCGDESSIHEAILYCKRSIEK
ncbi:probable membrane-associated kinase regulator 6 [Salvia miltiorrhiza]|uniref:probable membrane-associated kinase regulator 6 n=1 Tax=Salvia miltiorrhiza TaxID=226208 RepID=UPI0025AD744A|nr:probable membrane-associated kinase regulator 6 [Salvia miltiorrhiza]